MTNWTRNSNDRSGKLDGNFWLTMSDWLCPDLLLWLAVTERPGALRGLFDVDSVELDQVLKDQLTPAISTRLYQ